VGGGGWPPTECRAGDESDGHDTPPHCDYAYNNNEAILVLSLSFVFIMRKHSAGGGEVSG
jgi:hypothetical protein